MNPVDLTTLVDFQKELEHRTGKCLIDVQVGNSPSSQSVKDNIAIICVKWKLYGVWHSFPYPSNFLYNHTEWVLESLVNTYKATIPDYYK